MLEPHFLPSLLGASECPVWSPWERGHLPYAQWAQACSSHNPALAGAALWPAGGATQPLPQAAKVGSLVATLHNSEPLSPPQFIPSRYTVAAFYLAPFSVLWHLGCFSIPPNPRGRFLRRLVFGAGLSAHLLSGCGIPGGSCQGSQVSGLDMPSCRAYGQGPVPLVVRPAVNMLTTAARARLHGPEGCQSPSAAVCQVPGPAGCGYWLLDNICGGQTLSTEDTKALPKPCLSLLIGGRCVWRVLESGQTCVLESVRSVRSSETVRFHP